MRRRLPIILLLLLLAGSAVPARAASGLPVIGGTEEVVLFPWGIRLRARVDTGAAVSSLDARSIRVRTVKGQKVVRFAVAGDDGLQAFVELPLAGYRRVVSADGGGENRPLVELEACLAGQRILAQFSLNNRAHMEYHLLIGRNILAGRFLVHSGAQYLSPPRCPAVR